MVLGTFSNRPTSFYTDHLQNQKNTELLYIGHWISVRIGPVVLWKLTTPQDQYPLLTVGLSSLMLHAHHESPQGLPADPGTQPSISILSASWRKGRDAKLHILVHTSPAKKWHTSLLSSFYWPTQVTRPILHSVRQGGTILLQGKELWEGHWNMW